MFAITENLNEIIEYGIFDDDGLSGIVEDAPDYVKEAYKQLTDDINGLISINGHC